MKKYFFVILVLFLVQIAQAQQKYQEYKNSRYGFSVLIPNSLRNVEHSVNGDGCTFWDPLTEFRVIVAGGRVYKENQEDVIQIQELYKKELTEHESITYSLLKDGYYVVSGYDGAEIFYIKRYFDGEQEQTLVIKYFKSDKDEYDTMINKISKSFVQGKGDY